MAWLLFLILDLFLTPVDAQFRSRQATPFRTPLDCSATSIFDSTLLDCVDCPQGTIASEDRLRCRCPKGFFASRWVEGAYLECADCRSRNASSASRCADGCAEEGEECPRCATDECLCEQKNAPCSSGQVELVEWEEGVVVASDLLSARRATAETLCARGVSRECHHLANLCVLQNFALSSVSTCDAFSAIAQKATVPMPTLFYSEEASVELYRESVVDQEFNFVAGAEGSRLDLVTAVYSLNGSFLGLNTISDTTVLQLCPLARETKRGAFLMGRRYRESCEMNIEEIRATHPDTVFFDLSIRFRAKNGHLHLYPIPVLNENIRSHNDFVNRLGRSDDLKWVLTRRFFLTDFATKNGSLRVASQLQLHIQFQEGHDGYILPPFLRIRYVTLDDPEARVTVEFATEYSVDGGRYEKSLEIAMSVLCSISVLWAALRAYSWGRRSGKVLMDVTSLVKLVLYAAEVLADVFLLVIGVAALWIVFAYKKQQYIAFTLPTPEQEFSFVAYLVAALALKTVALLHRNVHLALTETFFVDWERSRVVADVSDAPVQLSRDLRAPRTTVPPVIWRTYMVANEWNELQQYRKTSVAFQLLCVLFLLHFLRLEQWTVVQPEFSLEHQPPEFEASRFSRFAVHFLVFLGVGFAQWTFGVLVVENLFTDPFHNFIDLCSVANVSVLALTHSLYGFYIHGRSVHGRADTGMLEMNEFLHREANNLVGQRGLESGTDLQTFTVSLPRAFRDIHDRILAAHRHTSPESRLSAIDKTTIKIEDKVKAHSEMNDFLVDLLSHTNPEVDFTVSDARFVEAVLDLELGDSSKIGNFVRDPSEMAFSRAFVHGNEWVHLSFELLLFCVSDVLFGSLILSAFITYATSSLISNLMSVLFTNNLVSSSLVDHRFLL
ncbi:hypothetical protein QR680_013203 [Steinernema hermaphroditum]|uniref:Meckelin n=1 Tax=Steinernema hermaphroditum TaxID=289476 RepID=A0AA39I7H8_9BILA|nr:hypothetical protein QR680_013203 [Steinernema hermaphroditum]